MEENKNKLHNLSIGQHVSVAYSLQVKSIFNGHRSLTFGYVLQKLQDLRKLYKCLLKLSRLEQT
jgi:hypothetical protein